VARERAAEEALAVEELADIKVEKNILMAMLSKQRSIT